MMAKASPEEVLRTIESARPYVDSVCLVVAPGDPLVTFESPLPTRIIEEPWQGFGETRTKTLRHAESDPSVDWILMVDAGDAFADGGRLPPLDGDVEAYAIPVDLTWPGGRWRWPRYGHVMRARRGFGWSSGVHEVLTCPVAYRAETWPWLVYLSAPATGRAGRYDEDAALLHAQLERDPTNTRAAFYFAQSLKDGGHPREALAAFLRRVEMGGPFVEEVFWAQLWAGKLAAKLGMIDRVEEYYLRAHEILPERAEPLRDLQGVFASLGLEAAARRYEALADAMPFPHFAGLFVDVLAYAPEVRP
jgi:tetratricopeptide (TPR) repeat protein